MTGKKKTLRDYKKLSNVGMVIFGNN